MVHAVRILSLRINRSKIQVMKKVPLIDRDGTLIKELPDEQIDSFGKLISV